MNEYNHTITLRDGTVIAMPARLVRFHIVELELHLAMRSLETAMASTPSIPASLLEQVYDEWSAANHRLQRLTRGFATRAMKRIRRANAKEDGYTLAA